MRPRLAQRLRWAHPRHRLGRPPPSDALWPLQFGTTAREWPWAHETPWNLTARAGASHAAYPSRSHARGPRTQMRRLRDAPPDAASYVWGMVAGTERVMRLLERRGPLLGDAGGLLFFAYWTAQAKPDLLPLGVVVVLDLATAACVGMALLGYQLSQGAASSAWFGWAGLAAVGLGFGGSLALVSAGLVLFGVSIVRCRVHPPLPGRLLVAAGLTLMASVAWAPGFGRAWGNLSVGWSVVMGAALVVVAAALADLDVIERAEARERSHVPA